MVLFVFVVVLLLLSVTLLLSYHIYYYYHYHHHHYYYDYCFYHYKEYRHYHYNNNPYQVLSRKSSKKFKLLTVFLTKIQKIIYKIGAGSVLKRLATEVFPSKGGQRIQKFEPHHFQLIRHKTHSKTIIKSTLAHKSYGINHWSPGGSFAVQGNEKKNLRI